MIKEKNELKSSIKIFKLLRKIIKLSFSSSKQIQDILLI